MKNTKKRGVKSEYMGMKVVSVLELLILMFRYIVVVKSFEFFEIIY